MLAIALDTPFTIVCKVLVVVEIVLEFTKLAEVVATTPLVILVKVKLLVVVATESVFVVDDATAFLMSTVVVTPLTLEVRLVPEAVRALLLIIVEVAVIPLVELLITLPLEDNVLDDITLLVATTPLIVVVKVLPERV